MATVEELEKRIQTLEDLEAIKRLKARYAQLCDERYAKGKEDLETIVSEFAKLFTEDAVWDGGKFSVCKGRKEIYEHFMKPTYSFAVHYFTMVNMTIDNNQASGSWILLVPATTFDNTAVWLAGQEDEEYIKINGQWLISHLKLTLFFHTPYDKGWARRRMIG